MVGPWLGPAHFGDDVVLYVEGADAALIEDTRRELELRWKTGSPRELPDEITIERGGRVARARAFEIPPGARVLLVVRHESAAPTPVDVPLTERQAQVLTLMQEGRTMPEIAEGLGVTLATARRHQVDVYRKLDAAQRGVQERSDERLADLGLTARQVEVVRHVCRGWSNAQVAKALHLSTVTIGSLLTTIYRKLRVKGRHALMAKVSRYLADLARQ